MPELYIGIYSTYSMLDKGERANIQTSKYEVACVEKLSFRQLGRSDFFLCEGLITNEGEDIERFRNNHCF